MHEWRDDWYNLIVFSTNKSTHSTTRSRYKCGRATPSLERLTEWSQEQGVTFRIIGGKLLARRDDGIEYVAFPQAKPMELPDDRFKDLLRPVFDVDFSADAPKE
jgi:hypothetical protein